MRPVGGRLSGRAELRHVSMSGRMHVSEPGRRIEVFTGAGRRRNWSPDEKAAIVAESYAGSDTVCGVARRHGLTSQQLFTWRRQARRASEPEGPDGPLFVPAVIEAVVVPQAPEPRPRSRRRSSSSGIELEIDGVAVRVGADASPKAISAVIRALKARS